MAAGPYAVDGVEDAGRGTEAAAAFLDRLAAVAAVHPVVALPYGDVDADALDAAGLSDVLVRSLPGSPEGTAQDPLRRRATPTAPRRPSPRRTRPRGADRARGRRPDGGRGAILADALDVEPRTDLAWAAGGSLRPDTLPTLQAGGVERSSSARSGLTEGETAVGLVGRPPPAPTRR